MLGVLFFFLQGVPFIYQGQELGMENYPWQNLDEFNDVSTFDQYQRALARGFSPEESFGFIRHRSRDNARIPMLWDDGKNAGFSDAKPWLPIHPDYVTLNAKAEQGDSDSVFAFYQKLIALRKTKGDLFFRGDFIPRFTANPEIIAYERALAGERAIVICNFSLKRETVDLSNSAPEPVSAPGGAWQVLLGNRRETGEGVEKKLVLEALEALVLAPAN